MTYLYKHEEPRNMRRNICKATNMFTSTYLATLHSRGY